MAYREYYWKKFKDQFWLACKILWHGVILNQGHHSNWGKTWFFKRNKK